MLPRACLSLDAELWGVVCFGKRIDDFSVKCGWIGHLSVTGLFFLEKRSVDLFNLIDSLDNNPYFVLHTESGEMLSVN